MVAITKLFMLTTGCLVAALPTPSDLHVRSTAALTISINNLDTSVQSLTAKANQFPGGLLGFVVAGPLILPSFTAVHTFNRLAYVDAQAISSISSDEAKALISVVHNGLSVDNPAAVAAVKAKRAQFISSGLKGPILAAMQLLLADHNSLSAVIASKAPQDVATQAAIKVEVDVIANALKDGIKYYS